MKLGTKIKELRKKKGLTQRDLSEKSGLSLRTIQRIENDENKPSVYSLRKIGEVLNHKFNLKKFNIMRNYSKHPRIRTQWFKNLQAEIGHVNTQVYKNLFRLAKNNRFLYKKHSYMYFVAKILDFNW